MLIDRIAASLPKENVIQHTYQRRKHLMDVFNPKPKPVLIDEHKPEVKRHQQGPKKPLCRDYLVLGGTDRVLPDWERLKDFKGPLAKIMQEVSHEHRVSVNDMKSGRRNKKVVYARFEYYYRAKMETLATLPEIGRFCGGKDHTTVLHGIKKHQINMAFSEHVKTWKKAKANGKG